MCDLQNAACTATEPFKRMRLRDCHDHLTTLEAKWHIGTAACAADRVVESIQSHLLDRNNDDTTVYKNSYIENIRVTALKERIERVLDEQDDDDQFSLRDRVRKLHECVHYCGMTAMLLTRSAMTVHPGYLPATNADLSMLRYEEGEALEKNPPLMRLIVKMLDFIHVNNYRRCEQDCYEMIKTSNGAPTQAWRKVMSLEALVYRFIGQGSNRDMMACAFTRGDCITSVVSHLCKMEDWRFPELNRSRKVVAFRNGLYITAYSTGPERWDVEDKFVPYDTPLKDRPYPDAAACKYFDQDIKEEWFDGRLWDEIKTENYQKILTTQGFDVASLDKTAWLYLMVGRLLHDVGSLDNWQCALFFKGTGDTGKSTIISGVIKRFYDPEDVGKIENNVERQFPLMDIYDKYLFVAPEIKRDFRLEQATFQSIITGECCSVAIKHCKPESIDRWTVPGVYAGNELPAFVDNAGSVSRRWFVANFETVVQEKDTRLDDKLRVEIPALYVKCNKAYLAKLKCLRSGDMWKGVDKYFTDVRAEVASSCNTIEHFITSGELKLDEDKFVSWSDFINALKKHAEENSLIVPRMIVDTYKPVLARHKLRKTEMCYRFYKGTRLNSSWVDGCEIEQRVDESTTCAG
jgi:hypothetical protein